MAKGKQTIYVGPAGNSNAKPLSLEGVALAAIQPGTILQQVPTGLQANAAAATVFGQLPLVADKNELQSLTVADNWTLNQNMVALQPRSGEFFNVLVATGQALQKGTALARNGAGLLIIAATNGTQEIVAYSDEVVTTTATQLVRVRFK